MTIRKRIANIAKLQSPARKRQFAAQFGWYIFIPLLELAAIGCISLFVAAVADPDFIHRKDVFVLNRMMDYLTLSPETLVLTLGSLALAAMLLKGAMRVASIYYGQRLMYNAEYEISCHIVKSLSRMPYQWHLHQNSAEMQFLVTGSSSLFRKFVDPAMNLIADTLMAVILLGFILFISPSTSIAIMGLFAVIGAVILYGIRSTIDRLSKSILNNTIMMNKNLIKIVHGIKDIVIAGREPAFCEAYATYQKRITRDTVKQNVITSLPGPILEVVGLGVIVSIVFVVMMYGSGNTESKIEFISVIVLVFWRMLPSMVRALTSITTIKKGFPAVDYVLDFLDLSKKEILRDIAGDQDREMIPFRESIALDNLCVRYKGADSDALHNVNVTIEHGTFVGLIGTSGAGKTTLIDTIIGLVEPTGGRILVDGREISPETMPPWRTRFGYVPQVPYVYDGTLAENIAFGFFDEEVDEALILKCCAKARIEFLDDLPNGIHTQIGERGSRLSGGQRQRVAIARALYRNPEVLIFDEATNSLDKHRAAKIRKTILSMRGSMTMLYISHGEEMMEDFDQVIWLEDGKVRKAGPPENILREYTSVSENADANHGGGTDDDLQS